jgi:LacI family transcriptional regulator
MRTAVSHRIALLFNANKVYDRQIMTGIAAYLASTRVCWDLFMEEDLRCRVGGIDGWQGDGIIADFDDPEIRAALAGSKLPLVAVGGSYSDARDYPAGVPYVATDNVKLVEQAYRHLVATGLASFAMFSVPESADKRWACERERAFCQLARRDRVHVEIYRGQATSAKGWDEAALALTQWLRHLPKPIGIIAVNDARARQLLQAALLADIAVPEQLALIGIDNDPLAHMMARVALSSVIQGGEEMGRTAAQLLHRMLGGARPATTPILVPPAGINVQASCRYDAASNPHVMRARHFIRQYAFQGIKAEQVTDYVGISRTALEAHFRQVLGRSVHEEILHFKLDAAKCILVEKERSISDVAVSCGFTTVQYMHAVFKRELGCTPRSFQDQASGAPACL